MPPQADSGLAPRISFKKGIVLLSLVLLSVLVAGAVLLREKLPPLGTLGGEETFALTGGEIAARIAGFLDNAVGETVVQFSYECGSQFESACKRKNLPNAQPYVEHIVLAYDALAQKTDDARYQEKIDRLMGRVREACKDDRTFCEWNFGALHALYKDQGDASYLNLMKLLDPVFLDEKMTVVGAVSRDVGVKLWMLYDATGDAVYRERLDSLERALLSGDSSSRALSPVLWTEGGVKVRQNGLLTAARLHIPAYKATGEKEYLKAAQTLFDNARVDKHIESLRSDMAVIMAEALLDLAELSDAAKAEDYRRQAVSVLRSIAAGRLDSAERPLFNGDGGILLLSRADPDEKTTVTVAWFAELYLRVSEEKFPLPR